MPKKTNRDGAIPSPVPFELDPISDQEQDDNRRQAREQLAHIRDHLGIKPGEDSRQIQQAIRHPTPNISSIRLPDSPQPVKCKCGRPTTVPDWSMNGVENPPRVCPGCTDLPERCFCEQALF